jgi:Iap family predicted aminopeptidase
MMILLTMRRWVIPSLNLHPLANFGHFSYYYNTIGKQINLKNRNAKM